GPQSFTAVLLKQNLCGRKVALRTIGQLQGVPAGWWVAVRDSAPVIISARNYDLFPLSFFRAAQTGYSLVFCTASPNLRRFRLYRLSRPNRLVRCLQLLPRPILLHSSKWR